ncbi:MAG: LD-carboxypeptidase [Victivallales bacterium]|nr:LD-carboxypeptidase [Victivallales bacterium]
MPHNPFPPRIRTVAVVAPAGPAASEAVASGCRQLQAWGLDVKVMPHVFTGADESYLAAPAAARRCDLEQCWREPDIDLVLCARGGFGTAHLLPHLDWTLLRSRPLPLIGYSDITALQLAMYRHRCGPLLAAPMCGRLGDLAADDYTCYYYARALADQVTAEPVCLPGGGDRMTVLQEGTAAGPLLAVNLAVAATLCGTPFMPDLSGHILLVEDVGEAVYRLDRFLTQLAQCGVLGGLAGLVFGSFRDCGTAPERERLFRRIGAAVSGPVLTGFPFGHTFPLAAVRQGRRAVIEADGRIRL